MVSQAVAFNMFLALFPILLVALGRREASHGLLSIASTFTEYNMVNSAQFFPGASTIVGGTGLLFRDR